jgi:hypothetical protein
MTGRPLFFLGLIGVVLTGPARGDTPARPKRDPGSLPPEVAQLLSEAARNQKRATEALANNRKKEAIQFQDRAVKELQAAKKKLTRLQKQKRSEEAAFLRQLLEQRCQYLAEAQRAIRASTVAIHKAIQANKDKKPNRADRQATARLAEREKAVLLQADWIIQTLIADGSAVGFLEVFKQLRADMEEIWKRLEKTDPGSLTQQIAQDVLESLDEIARVLKEARSKRKAKG